MTINQISTSRGPLEEVRNEKGRAITAISITNLLGLTLAVFQTRLGLHLKTEEKQKVVPLSNLRELMFKVYERDVPYEKRPILRFLQQEAQDEIQFMPQPDRPPSAEYKPAAERMPNPMPVISLAPIGPDEINTVNGRDLHLSLQESQPYESWITEAITLSRMKGRSGWVENEDYAVFESKMFPSNKKIREYALSLDMAKELAMMSTGMRGEQVRRYFIAQEKKLNQIGGVMQTLKGMGATIIEAVSNIFGSRMDQSDKMQQLMYSQQVEHSNQMNLLLQGQRDLSNLICELIPLIPDKPSEDEAPAPEPVRPRIKPDTYVQTYLGQDVSRLLNLPVKNSSLGRSALGLAGDMGWMEPYGEHYWKTTPMGRANSYVSHGTPNAHFTQKGLDTLREVVEKKNTKV